MILAIVGPTGVGKTSLSIALAKHYHAVIINFDSMQVYEQLDIGTAKVTQEEQEGIPHYLLSFVPLDRNYTVYDYQQDARKLIDKFLEEKKNIILVGGTGLYLKATLYNYEFTKNIKEKEYEELTNEEILAKIKSYQVDTYPHVNNRRRLVRLLNKLEQDEIISNKGNEPLYNFTIIGLTLSRDVLYQRINNRVEKMFDDGLLEEVSSVKEYFTISKALNTGIGYKEFRPFFEHKITLDEVKEQIKKNSRHYAKRQYTFFNHQFSTNWFSVDLEHFSNTIQEVITFIDKSGE